MVLDSAYEARDLDPWYLTTISTARRAFNAVYGRALGCPSGSSWQRLSRLASALRRYPISDRVVATDATLHLKRLASDGFTRPEVYRQFREAVVAPRRQLILDALRRGAEGGEIRSDYDPGWVNDQLVSRSSRRP